jgi:hypothetical protein
MRRMRVVVPALLIITMMMSGTALSENYVNLNLMGVFAQDEFRDNIDNGGGITGGYAYGFGLGSGLFELALGGDVGFMIYGNETIRTPFSNTVKRVEVEVETTNNMFLADLSARLFIGRGPVRPYLEGHAGLSYLYTDSKIKDIGYDDQEIASSQNYDDTTTNKAFGVGVLIPLVTLDESAGMWDEIGAMTICLDIRFLYWWGGKARYLRSGSISEDPVTGDLVYDVRESRTDMTSAHLGVVVKF